MIKDQAEILVEDGPENLDLTMRSLNDGHDSVPPIKMSLRVLIFEDSAEDADLCRHELSLAGFAVTADVTSTLEEFTSLLRQRRFDLILADFRVSGCAGMQAFYALQSLGLDIPFIIVTGTLEDQHAVECVKQGVSDYVLKTHLPRLPIAVGRALYEKRLRRHQLRAEAALKASEASFRSIFEGAACGLFRVNAQEDRFLTANPAFVQMLGYESQEELLALPSAAAVYEHSDAAAELLAMCKRQGRILKEEIECTCKDGRHILVRLSGRPVSDHSGAVVALEMVAEDITEQRRSEQRIQQLDRLYSVLSHVGQAIVRCRGRSELLQQTCQIAVEEGGFLMACVGLLDDSTGLLTPVAHFGREEGDLSKTWGSRTDDAYGRGPAGTCVREGQEYYCEDIEHVPCISPWRDEALRAGYRACGALPIRVREATIGAITFYATAPCLFDEQMRVLLRQVTADVSFALESMETEFRRRRAEQELDQFFTLSSHLLCILDMDGRPKRMNAAWEAALGFSFEELSSTPLTDLVHPDDRDSSVRMLEDLRGGHDIGFETRYRTRDGGFKWLAGHATPMADRGVIFLAAQDISDRMQLEEQLRLQNEELEVQNRRALAANQAKTEFLANMSHELRTPLNCIIGFSELLYDGYAGDVNAKQKDFLNDVLTSSKHLLQLINDLLDLAKLEAGRFEAHCEPVDPGAIIRDVVGIVQSFAIKNSIHVSVSTAATPPGLLMDPRILRQVTYNYLSNAIKFTQPGGTVSVQTRMTDSQEFRLEVCDTGVGIKAEDIPRLFQKFEQLEQSRTKRYGGTGLGLALVKRLVEIRGGRAGVESTPGRGSLFFAELPLAPMDAPVGSFVPFLPVENAAGPGFSDTRRCPMPARSQTRILLAEDNWINQDVALAILDRLGYTASAVSNGSEAVETLKSAEYDLVLMDCEMPELDGYEATRLIRDPANGTLNPRIPIIAVTAGAMANDRERCLQAGMDDCLSKPIEPEEMAQALAKWLTKREFGIAAENGATESRVPSTKPVC